MSNENHKYIDKLFISWTSRDEVSEKLARYFKTFFDTLFDDSIGTFFSKQNLGGESDGWFASINDELRKAKYGVFISTQDAINSEWCCYELGAICNNSVEMYNVNKRIFPIKFSQSKEDKLDKAHTPFGHVGVFEFNKDNIELLVDTILEESFNKGDELAFYKTKDKVRRLFKNQWVLLHKNCCEELQKNDNRIVPTVPEPIGNPDDDYKTIFKSSNFWLGRWLGLEDYLVEKYKFDGRNYPNRMYLYGGLCRVITPREKDMFDKLFDKSSQMNKLAKQQGIPEESEEIKRFYTDAGASDAFYWLKYGGRYSKLLLEDFLTTTPEHKKREEKLKNFEEMKEIMLSETDEEEEES